MGEKHNKRKDSESDVTKNIECLTDDLDTTKEVLEIKNIESKNNDELNDTKVVFKIDDVKENGNHNDNSDIDDSKNDDDSVDKSFVEKPKKYKRIVAIVLIFIIFILFVILIFILNKNRKIDNDGNDYDSTDIVLTEEEKKEIINSYGQALESIILINYQKNNVILSFDEANKLVDLESDVICSQHEIYDDGKVYLAKCSINGRMTDYVYGEKQKPKEPFDSGTMIKVYVNSVTNERSLKEPDNMENVDEYTVHCDEKYESPTLLGNSDYVFYFDSEYNVKMKNFKTDKIALENVHYASIFPFMIENKYYDDSYVAVSNGEKWAIYNLENEKIVVDYIYDNVINLNTGVSGPVLAINTLKDRIVTVYKNSKYGLINYTNGKEVIPINYDTFTRSGNYIWAENYDDKNGVIYDFAGNTYLNDKYDDVYGIAGGAYVLVSQKGSLKLVQMDGKVLYDYGVVNNLGNLNFAFEYNNEAIFQFYKNDPTELSVCVEYSYNPTTKKGTFKDIMCGGIAKPILYLYPDEKANVTVSFEHPEFLETTYPKFKNNWQMTAFPNGDLFDENNKYYYALYWDEKKVHTVNFDEGFYVESDNAIKFLEEKLSYIGLNDKERNEFIMYWLPILEKNKKSLVYFELTEERESYNKLFVTPKPDSMLRVVIHIKKVNEKVDIKKQTLKKFKREGFTVVEWGGTTY